MIRKKEMNKDHAVKDTGLMGFFNKDRYLGVRFVWVAHRFFLTRVKIPLYRQWFLLIKCRFDYPVVKGRVCAEYRKLFSGKIQYTQSICNAGLIRTRNRWISIFKNQTFTIRPDVRKKPESVDTNLKRLYYTEFDDDWNVRSFRDLKAAIGGKRILADQGLEDARLFIYKGELWMCATLGGHLNSAWPYFGKLQGEAVELVKPRLDVESPQKNWMPFEYDGQLYLEYSVSPRRVLRFNPKSDECEFIESDEQDWYPGTIHGGAPAVRFSDDFFLGVANVQDVFWYQERYYAAVFYLFEARSPFRVQFATRPVRLGSRRERVQYVTGMVFDPSGESLILSFGLNDYDNRILEVDVTRIGRMMRELKND